VASGISIPAGGKRSAARVFGPMAKEEMKRKSQAINGFRNENRGISHYM
jgi:hypothetical protein